MSNSPQPDTTKLDTYYKHALDNSGKDEFYTFLYKYIETIKRDEQLSKTVNNFWIKQLTEDFRAIDNETFKKALLPYLAEHGLNDNQADSLTNFQQFEVMWRTLAANRLWSTKPYACWFILDRQFYSKIRDDVDVSQPIAPSNSTFTQADYTMALRVFHTDFISWLTHNPNIFIESETTSLNSPKLTKATGGVIGNAHLRLDGRVLYVDLPNEHSEVFCTYREGLPPHSLMEYIYKTYKTEPDTEYSLTDFASKVDGLMYDTMANALRACGFDKYVKPLFFKRAPKGKIKFSPTKSINEIELQYILNCAKKNEQKRKSTGSHKKSDL